MFAMVYGRYMDSRTLLKWVIQIQIIMTIITLVAIGLLWQHTDEVASGNYNSISSAIDRVDSSISSLSSELSDTSSDVRDIKLTVDSIDSRVQY